MNNSAVIFDDASFQLVQYPADVAIINPLMQTFKSGETRTISYNVVLRDPWTGQSPPDFTALLQPTDELPNGNMPYIAQQVTGLKGGATYAFSAWARTAPDSTDAHAAVKIENYNAAGQNTSGHYGTLTLPNDGSWQKVSVTCQVDPDTIRSTVLIRVMNKSVIIFDDASFQMVQHPNDLPRDLTVQNSNFENGLESWYLPFAGEVSTEPTDVHNGNEAIKIDAIQHGDMPYIAQSVSGLEGGATYKFSVWARMAPGSPSGVAGVKIENYNAASQNTTGYYGTLSLPEDGSWQNVSVTCQADPDTIRSSLLIRVMNNSAIIFDDASFQLVGYPADLPKELPLQNANFENSLTSWAIPNLFVNEIDPETTIVHSGAGAVKIDATQPIPPVPIISSVREGIDNGNF
jgi:hypothetical protein